MEVNKLKVKFNDYIIQKRQLFNQRYVNSNFSNEITFLLNNNILSKQTLLNYIYVYKYLDYLLNEIKIYRVNILSTTNQYFNIINEDFITKALEQRKILIYEDILDNDLYPEEYDLYEGNINLETQNDLFGDYNKNKLIIEKGNTNAVINSLKTKRNCNSIILQNNINTKYDYIRIQYVFYNVTNIEDINDLQEKLLNRQKHINQNGIIQYINDYFTKLNIALINVDKDLFSFINYNNTLNSELIITSHINNSFSLENKTITSHNELITHITSKHIDQIENCLSYMTSFHYLIIDHLGIIITPPMKEAFSSNDFNDTDYSNVHINLINVLFDSFQEQISILKNDSFQEITSYIKSQHVEIKDYIDSLIAVTESNIIKTFEKFIIMLPYVKHKIELIIEQMVTINKSLIFNILQAITSYRTNCNNKEKECSFINEIYEDIQKKQKLCLVLNVNENDYFMFSAKKEVPTVLAVLLGKIVFEEVINDNIEIDTFVNKLEYLNMKKRKKIQTIYKDSVRAVKMLNEYVKLKVNDMCMVNENKIKLIVEKLKQFTLIIIHRCLLSIK